MSPGAREIPFLNGHDAGVLPTPTFLIVPKRMALTASAAASTRALCNTRGISSDASSIDWMIADASILRAAFNTIIQYSRCGAQLTVDKVLTPVCPYCGTAL